MQIDNEQSIVNNSKLQVFKMNPQFVSGSTLKIFAIAAMFIDHFGQTIIKRGIILNVTYDRLSDSQFSFLLSSMEICHKIGWLAFPIFCFLIVEGFKYTHDIKKYIARLFIFALISEIPYDLAFAGKVIDFSKQNVFFTLTLGLLVISIIKYFKNNYFVIPAVTILAIASSYYGKFDGNYYGIILILLFYVLKNHGIAVYVSVAIWMLIAGGAISLSSFIPMLSLIPIYFYNGKRGLNLKYVFYIFYPGHLILLFLITNLFIIPYFL